MSIEKKTTPGVGTIDVKLEVAQRLERSAAAQAAFRELELDAPTGEGPIVRKARALMTPKPVREAEPSDRKEHVARAEVHTNPLPEPVPEEKVVSNARPEPEPQTLTETLTALPRAGDPGAVTLPDIRKKEALAPMAVPTGGRAINGTLRLAVPPPVPPSLNGAATLDDPTRSSGAGEHSDDSSDAAEHQYRGRRVTVLVALALFAVVCALVLWLVARVREQEREQLLRESAAAVASVTAPITAVATALAVDSTAPTVSVVPTASVTGEHTVTNERPTNAKPTASARASAPSAEPVPTPSVKPSAKPPTTAASTGSGGWIE